MTLYGRSDAGVGQSERDIPANMLQSAVAILAHLETEQLEKMNEDETEMINIIDDSEIVKSVQTEREDLVTSNKRLEASLLWMNLIHARWRHAPDKIDQLSDCNM